MKLFEGGDSVEMVLVGKCPQTLIHPLRLLAVVSLLSRPITLSD